MSSTVPTTDADVMLNSLGPTPDFPHWSVEETNQMVESSNVNSEALATFSQQPAATEQMTTAASGDGGGGEAGVEDEDCDCDFSWLEDCCVIA